MDEEIVKILIDHFSNKYPESQILFTGESFRINGVDKDLIVLEIQTFINALNNGIQDIN